MKITIYLFILVFLSATSCKVKEKHEINLVPPNAILVKVIDFSDLDGCTMMLEMENGDKLQPLNLPEKFSKAGMQLFITYKYSEGISICMSGKLVQLNYISEAK